MKFRNPFKELTKFEMMLWLISLAVVSISCVMSKAQGTINCIASLIGVTALIFVSKGDVFGQFLTVVFSILYAVSSYQFRYYGEMITYMGMTAPMAVASIISWIKNPFKDSSQVKIEKLSKMKIIKVFALTIFVTTVSIATSFLASYFTYLRSHFYAAAYAANDIVLIVLWILASVESISYLPMVFCFVMFFVNDIYGFYNWGKMKKL